LRTGDRRQAGCASDSIIIEQGSFMSHIHSNRRPPAATAVVLGLLLACLGLAACGGSSKTSSTSANAAATTPAGTGTSKGTAGTGAARFKAMRECLQKEMQKDGITLPNRTPGQRPGGPGGRGGFLGAGGPQLPKGVTRAQYEAALKKCGGGGGVARRGKAFDSPAFKQALTKFAACMRENGVNVPAPDTSGKGPVFDTKGIDTASSQFRTAEMKCSSNLRQAFQRGSGTGGAASGAGAAPGSAPGGTPAG
jgi:hypothetical protein